MRREPTDAERKLWSIIRGKQLDGFRFRRQVPIAGYVVDFFCVEKCLVLEADGGQHLDPAGMARDEKRDATLTAKGVRILRLSDIDILRSPIAVAETILRELHMPWQPPPQPSPGVPGEGVRGGGDDLIAALLASDLAAEVKAEFEGRLSVGFDVPAATQHVFARFREALSNPNDGPVVLLALAALQLREGHLLAVIRDAATDLITSGEAAAAYRAEDSQIRSDRRQMLEQFADALQTAKIEEDSE
jgi:very-short-patch-repair endonuclease